MWNTLSTSSPNSRTETTTTEIAMISPKFIPLRRGSKRRDTSRKILSVAKPKTRTHKTAPQDLDPVGGTHWKGDPWENEPKKQCIRASCLSNTVESLASLGDSKLHIELNDGANQLGDLHAGPHSDYRGCATAYTPEIIRDAAYQRRFRLAAVSIQLDRALTLNNRLGTSGLMKRRD